MNLFKAIVGSQAYGTATPQSDIDYKGIFHEEPARLLGFSYRQQIEWNKDHVDFEIKRFLELLRVGNPTILELLFSPDDCVITRSPVLGSLFAARNNFLTKKCKASFGGYAATQIRKARGLDKKMNWHKDKADQKKPIQFCYIAVDGKTYPFAEFLKSENKTEQDVGLVNLDHAPHCCAVYFGNNYRGVFGENSDFILTSSIPKGEKSVGVLVYNRDAYKKHLSEWRDYQTWLAERNTARYVDNVNHDQKIDSKNMLHVKRLLDMATEIPKGKLIVRRPNADYLLKIRRGEVNLLDLIKEAEEQIAQLDDLYGRSDLPDEAPEVESILLQIRYNFLKNKI